MSDLKDLCINLPIAQNQRKNEVARGEETSGTKGYEATGCYECEGYNKKCGSYTPVHQVARLGGMSLSKVYDILNLEDLLK